MIEVEIRGRLTDAQYESLKAFLAEKGTYLGHFEREMYILRGHPGFSMNSLEREVDIRLRNTNGECEIMMKRKVSDHNLGRKETSLRLKDNDLEAAKRIVRGLGITNAMKVFRIMDRYQYHDTEWQIVGTRKGLWYWEAEKTANDEAHVPEVRAALEKEAATLNLPVLTPEQYLDFIHVLDREVNEEVEL